MSLEASGTVEVVMCDAYVDPECNVGSGPTGIRCTRVASQRVMVRGARVDLCEGCYVLLAAQPERVFCVNGDRRLVPLVKDEEGMVPNQPAGPCTKECLHWGENQADCTGEMDGVCTAAGEQYWTFCDTRSACLFPDKRALRGCADSMAGIPCPTCAQLRVQMETLRMEPTDVLVVRLAFGDMDLPSQQATLTSMYTSFRDWLRERKVPHAGIIVLPPDHDIEKIPVARLRTLLDGEWAARAARLHDGLVMEFSTEAFADLDEEKRDKIVQRLLAAVDGARACAADNGEADHPCFMEGPRAAKAVGDACGGDGWFRCPECALYREGAE
jgi:hypothetical protein